jgi:uncharacterized protein (TIGR00730 family)
MSKNKKYINIACIVLIIIIVVIAFYYVKKNYLGVNSNKTNKINITIFCSGIGDSIDKKYFEKTRELINKLNEYKNMINIVYGGAKRGLMGEIAMFKGNLISSNLKQFVDPSMEDEYIFDNIQDRQNKLIELGDMYIILPGGYGTNYELIEVLTLNDIGESKKPIIIYNIDNFFDGFIKYFDELSKKRFLSHKIKELNVHIFNNPNEVINFIRQIKY